MKNVNAIREYSAGEWAFLAVIKVLTVALLTAIVGALANIIYASLIDPRPYSAGAWTGSFVFLVYLSFPYIVAGLFVLGLPTAFLLQRLRGESTPAYAVAGILTGCLWGTLVIGAKDLSMLALFGFYGSVGALLWWWLQPKNGRSARWEMKKAGSQSSRPLLDD